MSDIAARIVADIGAHPNITARELAAELGAALPTIHDHLRKLRAHGMIQRGKYGRYTITPTRAATVPSGVPLHRLMAGR